jgi:CheY-like chemotaxis protein
MGGSGAVAKAKILLVDDTRLVLELEKSYLKLSHVEILTAGNGAEALELIRKEPPDLIFMDLNMPVMDGLTCCSELKADPFLCGIPLVMVTTAGRDGDRDAALKAGCDDFITKPIDRREFLELARKYTDEVDRRELRIPCLIPVIFLLGDSPVSAHAMDICDGGLFLASLEQVERDLALRLVLYLPAAKPLLLELNGRVAWVNEEGNRVKSELPPGFGVEFLGLKEHEVEALKAFVEAESLGRAGQGPRY